MELIISTVYTKQRFLRFNDYFWAQRKGFLAIFAVCTLIVWGCALFLSIFDALSDTIRLCCGMVTVLDVTLLFSAFVIPRLTAKKSPAIDAMMEYCFNEEDMNISSETKTEKANATFKYAAIVKVGKRNDDVYLFISARQAYIVDVSELSEIELLALKALVTSHLPARKVKWK